MFTLFESTSLNRPFSLFYINIEYDKIGHPPVIFGADHANVIVVRVTAGIYGGPKY